MSLFNGVLGSLGNIFDYGLDQQGHPQQKGYMDFETMRRQQEAIRQACKEFDEFTSHRGHTIDAEFEVVEPVEIKALEHK